MGGHLRDPDERQRRSNHDGCDDVGRRHRYGKTEYPDCECSVYDGKEDAAAGQGDDDASDLQPQSSQRNNADDDSGCGRGCGDRKDTAPTRFERGYKPSRFERVLSFEKTTATAIAENTARNGVIPFTSSTTMTINDTK